MLLAAIKSSNNWEKILDGEMERDEETTTVRTEEAEMESQKKKDSNRK